MFYNIYNNKCMFYNKYNNFSFKKFVKASYNFGDKVKMSKLTVGRLLEF